MDQITQIRKLSLWIFLIPLISINFCLFISVNHNLFDNTIFYVDHIGRSGFSIPYLDGSLSISRASRTYPQFLIFKPSMFITSILLCFFWIKNSSFVNSFGQEKHKNNNFMIYGVLSAVFLFLHSMMLGINTDVQILKFLKRIFLLGFIIFEIMAQTILVYNFYKLKEKLTNFINLKVLKLKIILVLCLSLVALFSIPLLIKSGNVHFKHALEWNYFIAVIFFYLLTRFFWKKNNSI